MSAANDDPRSVRGKRLQVAMTLRSVGKDERQKRPRIKYSGMLALMVCTVVACLQVEISLEVFKF